MENTKVNIDELNIDELKLKHKTVKLITVEAKDKSKHEFVVGRPTQSHIDMIVTYLNNDKYPEYRKVMRNSCVLAGDKTVIDNDDDVRKTVFSIISDMMNEKLETTEKEL